MLNIIIVSATWIITVIFLVSVISGFISKRVSNKTYGRIVVADDKLPDVLPAAPDVLPAAVEKAPVRAVPVNKVSQPQRLWHIKHFNKNTFKYNRKLRMPAVTRHIDMLC